MAVCFNWLILWAKIVESQDKLLGPYFWRGEAKAKGMAHVLGMFPGKSLKSGVPEMGFQAVWGGVFGNIPMIIKYINDMSFYDIKNVPFPRHLFLEINQLEKSLWKTGGGVRAVTFFPSMMLGGKNTISF